MAAPSTISYQTPDAASAPPSGGAPSGALPGSNAPFGGIVLGLQTLTVNKHGRIQVLLSCPANSIGSCVGTDTLQTAGKVFAARKSRRHVLTLGQARFSIRGRSSAHNHASLADLKLRA